MGLRNDIHRAAEALSRLLASRPKDALAVAKALRRLITPKLGLAYGWKLEVSGSKANGALLDDFRKCEARIDMRRAEVNRVVSSLYRRLPASEAVDLNAPDVQMIMREEPQFLAQDEAEAFIEFGRRQLIEYCAQDGPVPEKMLRRLFMYLRQFHPELVVMASGSDVAKMFGTTKAAESWRVHKLMDGKTHTRSMKTEGARENYRRASLGNRNRRNGTMRKEHGDGD